MNATPVVKQINEAAEEIMSKDGITSGPYGSYG